MSEKPKNLTPCKIEFVSPIQFDQADISLLADLLYKEVLRKRYESKNNQKEPHQQINRSRPALSLVKTKNLPSQE